MKTEDKFGIKPMLLVVCILRENDWIRGLLMIDDTQTKNEKSGKATDQNYKFWWIWNTFHDKKTSSIFRCRYNEVITSMMFFRDKMAFFDNIFCKTRFFNLKEGNVKCQHTWVYFVSCYVTFSIFPMQNGCQLNKR